MGDNNSLYLFNFLFFELLQFLDLFLNMLMTDGKTTGENYGHVDSDFLKIDSFLGKLDQCEFLALRVLLWR